MWKEGLLDFIIPRNVIPSLCCEIFNSENPVKHWMDNSFTFQNSWVWFFGIFVFGMFWVKVFQVRWKPSFCRWICRNFNVYFEDLFVFFEDIYVSNVNYYIRLVSSKIQTKFVANFKMAFARMQNCIFVWQRLIRRSEISGFFSNL